MTTRVKGQPDWRVLTPFIVVFAGVAVWGLVKLVQQAADPTRSDHIASAVIVGAWVVTWFLALAGLLAPLHTVLSAEGIEIRSFGKTKAIRWQDVVKVSWTRRGLKIQSTDQWIAIMPDLFRNREEIVRTIRERVPPHATFHS